MKDIELLQYVHETASMGVPRPAGPPPASGKRQDETVPAHPDPRVPGHRSDSAKLLQSKGSEPKDPGLMARLSSQAMATMKTLAGSSDSKLAEMVIQGNNMGVTKGLKHLHDYQGNDPKIRALAEKLLATEQANVSQMQPFL